MQKKNYQKVGIGLIVIMVMGGGWYGLNQLLMQPSSQPINIEPVTSVSEESVASYQLEETEQAIQTVLDEMVQLYNQPTVARRTFNRQLTVIADLLATVTEEELVEKDKRAVFLADLTSEVDALERIVKTKDRQKPNDQIAKGSESVEQEILAALRKLLKALEQMADYSAVTKEYFVNG